MMEPDRPDCKTCRYHIAHTRVLEDHDKQFEKLAKMVDSVWVAIEKRVTNKFFIILVTLVIGGLGFQWVNYEKLSSIATKVAIIQATIKFHTQKDVAGSTLFNEEKY